MPSLLALALLVFAMSASITHAQVTEFLSATLKGTNENPSVLTDGWGALVLLVAPDESTIDFQLRYSHLTAPVTGAHIHLGKPWENGGIIVDLCAVAGSCPPASDSDLPVVVTGQITAASVKPVTDPNDPNRVLLKAEDLGGLIRALTEDATYVNVHTEANTGGEIRGNIE
jgi:hypothetical protein